MERAQKNGIDKAPPIMFICIAILVSNFDGKGTHKKIKISCILNERAKNDDDTIKLRATWSRGEEASERSGEPIVCQRVKHSLISRIKINCKKRRNVKRANKFVWTHHCLISNASFLSFSLSLTHTLGKTVNEWHPLDVDNIIIRYARSYIQHDTQQSHI